MFSGQEVILLIIVATLATGLLIAFIIYLLFAHKKNQNIYLTEIENIKSSFEKTMLQTQLEIQEQTFLDISREIHDNIGLSLTLAKLQLNTIDPLNPDKISESVNSSVQLIGKAIHDLSDISKSLNSETIKTQGLYNTLKVETERISYSGKIDIQFATEGEAVFLDAQIGRAHV